MERIELLAPAGKWEVLEQVVAAGADAVYLGGKDFNMRMLKAGFNFSNREIKAAAEFAHENNRKVYITVNNLYNDQEINRLRDYLIFLEQSGADGLIVQDMGIVEIYRELDLKMPLHASVQMGIGSSSAVKYLEDLGFARAILSKNLTIEEIEIIHNNTDLEIEYFAHGDLCISHAGQCFFSTFMEGKSANKGACIKPCRWQYDLNQAGDFKWRLASNDLCLYPYLKELIKAGVISFKIEGRMREKEYLGHLVGIYRQALDRLKYDFQGYALDEQDLSRLDSGRIRNFTAGNLWGLPIENHVDATGTREPLPIGGPSVINPMPLNQPSPPGPDLGKGKIEELSIKTGNLTGFLAAMNNGADNLIIGLEQYRQFHKGWDRDSINKALAAGKSAGIKVWLETPRIVTEKDVKYILNAARYTEQTDGIIVNDYGSLRLFKEKGFKILGGPGLNITNSAAALSVSGNGLTRITASPELEYENLNEILKTPFEIELVVHGPLCGMITDYCLASDGGHQAECSASCLRDNISLKDLLGQEYIVRTDSNCRNYIYYPCELCLYEYLGLLKNAGLKYIRIDGQFYDEELAARVTSIYRKSIDRLNNNEVQLADDGKLLSELFPRGLSAVPLIKR